MRFLQYLILTGCVVVGSISAISWWPASYPSWTEEERALMASLTLDRLPPPPPDLSNRVADNAQAARFGQALFFDPRLSGTGGIACATCHQPARRFTDGLPRGHAIGPTARHTPSIIGAAYSPWQYWDGRRDSLWAQALSPLEDPNEHGGQRTAYARFISEDPAYRAQYESLFGALPDLSDDSRFPRRASPLGDTASHDAWALMTPADQDSVNEIFSNLGKAIAAYERKLTHGPARFDRYVAKTMANDSAATELLTADEAQGLRLFLGKGRCTECHNGPLFTNHEFHNTGILAAPNELPDRGRIEGLRKLREDPFNCRGSWNDEPEAYCGELDFARDGIELIGAFRTPSLRNVVGTAPYMHKGQLASLEAVIRHYNDTPFAMIGHNEAEFPLSLSRRERRQLEAFLHTLDSPLADAAWATPPAAASSAAADTRTPESRNRAR